jgi:hypothetical protein
MARVLKLLLGLCVSGLAVIPAASAGLSDRHELQIRLDLRLSNADTDLGAWPEGGFGKLRYAGGAVEQSTLLTLEYRGQLARQLYGHAVLDYVDDADSELGLTEAYLEWRPLPTGPNRHRVRFGAFYPPFSYENSDFAWDSPYSYSFSAVNSWIAEEIRPIGADWRLSRSIGAPGSPIAVDAFAGLFAGNDTAATFLFWRGWAMHDRQTRLNERLPLPPLVLPSSGSGPDTIVARKLDPIAEIDDSPGIYLGGEWSYRQRAKLSIAYWDNLADPYAFRDGQWAWDTRFWHFATQIALPRGVGLIAQRMRGDTDWVADVPVTGRLSAATPLVSDEFDSSFILLSKLIGQRHRISIRRDEFHIWRPGQLEVDNGDAETISYSFLRNPGLEIRLEWIRTDSRRDLWPLFYGQTDSRFTEEIVQLGIDMALFDSSE